MTEIRQDDGQMEHRATLETDDRDYPEFLGSRTNDVMAHVCFELAAELWVTRSRLQRLGALLEVNGVSANEALDSGAVELSAAEEAAMQEERTRFIRQIFDEFRRA